MQLNLNYLSIITAPCIIFSSLMGILLLLKKKENRKINWYFTAFLFSVNLSIFNIAFLLYTGNFRLFPHLLSFSTISMYFIGPLFFLYVKKAMHSDRYYIQELLHFFIPLIIILLNIPFMYKSGEEKIRVIELFLDGTLTTVTARLMKAVSTFGVLHMGTYFIWTFFKLKKYRNESKEIFSNLPTGLYYWLKNCIFFNLLVESAFVIGIVISISQGSNYNILYHLVPVVISSYMCILGIKFFSQGNLFFYTSANDKPEIQDKAAVVQYDATLPEIINQTLVKKEIYKNPDLSLPKLAEILEIPRNKLSEVINHHFNMNFYDFINRCRIENVKEMISVDPVNIDILSIAYNSGFKSKTTFHVCFKRYEKITPSQYKKRILEQISS